ncbi:Protein translocase subunit secA [Candidatus Westeberhardia cardiocondylae]|uniref:Protein translocase subunit SecA n=1 Tax=Candidatus Westeberhardia cardiocondylae TaxID=1594731 RepID=A0A0H5BWM4_9ENTR|nr:preprotein translocase subunit SecA [Candidatus Westeberhardia cardiocondylae]CEN32107.1 Protein translocase subunit secA [Candidatus Westeberhardia cardiocondylae]
MLIKLLNKIFGSYNERTLHKMKKIVKHINNIEVNLKNLSNEKLSKKTIEFRSKIDQGLVTIRDILPEAFAVVREASKRIFGMRHFDVQLLGGIALNDNYITEMRTGEGKTLTATLPAYLNALTKKGVHIVTVNDYLAKRDAENNKKLFNFLNMTVGINLPGMSISEKKIAYSADITYGTNNEYGFDYLRDNMVFNIKDRVQRKLHYALIDEVDSILIDEARTPLIISGQIETDSNLYHKIDKLIIPYLNKQNQEDSYYFQGTGHFSIDEKTKQINLTERGMILIEKLLVKNKILKEKAELYLQNNLILIYYIISAIRAHVLFFRNIDYIIKNNKIIIIDEHTGRPLPNRRWSDGLHQAIEAKENVTIQEESQTLASITFQNYFRLYEKLSGMTGTARTESFEFNSIYKLNTIVIPTNRLMIRKDFSDLIYITEKEKIHAIIQDIKKCNKRGQPILVGTISIEKSEFLSKKLKKENIPHKILNAKFYEMEANIIAQAGKPGAVTIATNMAGRGTDIILGGNWKEEINSLKIFDKKKISTIKKQWKKRHNLVLSVGGLHIIGTERHESRRIDNQLRGRSGRQGDIGSSRFYLSMEDTLMRIFSSNRIFNIIKKLGIKQNEAIEHPWINKAIANAQKKVENRNFEIRKQLLEYDDVINDQRQIVYIKRNQLLSLNNIQNIIKNFRKITIKNILKKYFISNFSEKNQNIKIEKCLKNDFNLKISISLYLRNQNIKNKNNKKQLYKYIVKKLLKKYKNTETILGTTSIRDLEKNITLQTIDNLWQEHLTLMEHLRNSVHLRSYAQKDPKQEYKRESFIMFSNMLDSLQYEVISTLSKINTKK